MFVRLLIATAALATPVAVSAQSGGAPPQRIRSVPLQPGQACPKSTSDEVIVCVAPETDQYRIPKALREEPKTTPANTSWAVRSERVMQDNRRVLPNSCSAVGTGGQTGCAQQAAENWAIEKRNSANGYPLTPND